MTEQNKPIRQSAEVWVKRLLSGPWGAAATLGLPKPSIESTDRPYSDKSLLDATRKRIEEVAEEQEIPFEESPASESTAITAWKSYRRQCLAQFGKYHLLFSFKQFDFLLAGLYHQDRVQFQPIDPAQSGQNTSYVVTDLIEGLKTKKSISLDLDDFALRTTLNQIASDLFVLDRASIHHQTSQKQAVWERMQRADEVARHAVSAMQANLPPNLTVLTYLDRVANVRVVPYAAVALIGIPPTALVIGRDLLAIAHELGHFLYWNGYRASDCHSFHELAFDTCQNPADEGDRLILRWIEEIVADVAGCLIAGPAIALAFQDMALEKTGRSFVEEDGKHPIPALRPFIYIQALRCRNLKEAAYALTQRWESVLTGRLGNDWRVRQLPESSSARIELHILQKKLMRITRQVYEWFEVGQWTSERKEKIWSQEVFTDERDDQNWVEMVYTEFENNLPRERLPDIKENTTSNEYTWTALVQKRKYLEENEIRALESDDSASGNPITIPAEKWLRVLLFDGWNTGGPTGGLPH